MKKKTVKYTYTRIWPATLKRLGPPDIDDRGQTAAKVNGPN